MIKKKVFFLSSLVTMLFLATTVSVSTFAWFTGRNNIDTKDQLGGSVLASYFHSGNGTTEPFTITTPWHYENFVKLHYNVTGFAEQGYSFEFGAKILGSETPVFFKTDERGVVDRTQTSTTLDLGGMSLMPLGTQEQPFFAQVKGNDLTVSHFTIDGKGYTDIGIFGYVASATNPTTGLTQRANISNCYWKNFTINTKDSSASAHPHAIAGAHPDNTEVGYLAGHVVDAASFTNCYVNDCEINGVAPQDAQNNSYSYYGKAEKDALGGEMGKGHDYKYHLDSEAIYRSVNNKYEEYKNTPIRARTEIDTITGKEIQYADYTTPINGEMPEVVNSVTKYPTSSALAQDGSQYNLGGSVRGSTAARNYSFSSLGYQPLTSNSSVREYKAYYENGSTEAQMPENVVRKNEWDGKTVDVTTKDSLSTIGETGDFYHYNGSEWRYVHSENSNTEGRDKKKCTFKLSTNSSYTLDGFLFLEHPELESAAFYLYIDGVQVSYQDVKSSTSIERNWWKTELTLSNIKLKTSSISVNLQRGVHYYCFFFCAKSSTNQGHYSYLCNSSNSVSITTGGRLSCTAGTFTVTQDMYDGADSARTFSFNATSSGCSSNSDSGNPIEMYSIDSRAHNPTTDIPAYVKSGSYQKTLKGKSLSDGTVITLSDSSMLWKKESGYETQYDAQGNPIQVYWYRWIAYYTPTIEVDYNAITQYFADDPNITTYWKEGKAYTGYSYKNLDIVGGGVSFYYRTLLTRQLRVISITAESTNAYSCAAVPAADIAAHKHFYATKYCPTSIVMYLKNTANAADETDHTLGKVAFEYVNAEFLGTSWINISVPAFKKGSGNFIDLSQFGTLDPSGTVLSLLTTYKYDITESGAKTCSYCALDKNGDIIGVFDSNGKPSTGLVDKDGNPDIQKLLAIDTYVLALGTQSNYEVNTWITSLDFEYKAEDGYGGTFGTVGYRDSDDKIESTILNFYYNLNALVVDPNKDIFFKIKVKYVDGPETIVVGESEVTYQGHYEITASASSEVALKIYNYDTTNYYIKYNNNNYFSESITTTVPTG